MAYRQFHLWIFRGERLGKGVRTPLPSCGVTAIRLAFPEEDNAYIGFKEVQAALDLDE